MKDITVKVAELVTSGSRSNIWFKNLERWSEKAGIIPKVNPKTPRRTNESWMFKAGVPQIENYPR